jgi:predicted anti-sigma-YlaC factor YlaD
MTTIWTVSAVPTLLIALTGEPGTAYQVGLTFQPPNSQATFGRGALREAFSR